MLAWHKHGTLIDAADAIFRVNNAPVQGVEDHVGSRTDVRVWASRDSTLSWAGGNDTSIVVFCQPTRWVGRCWQHIAPNARQPHPFPRLSPLLWMDVRESMVRSENTSTHLNKHATGGAVALYMAMQLCERVRIFGFGDQRNAWNCRLRGPPRGMPREYFEAAFGENRNRTTSHLCGKYYHDGARADRPSKMRLACGSKSKYASYMRDAARYHNMELEERWLGRLFSSGQVEAAPCERERSGRGEASELQPGGYSHTH